MHTETSNTIKQEALLRLWNSAHIRLSDMQHLLLIQESAKLSSENPSFLFLRGKVCTVQLGQAAIQVTGSVLFHVGRGQTLRVPAAAQEVEIYQASYQAQLPQSAGIAFNNLLMMGGPLDTTLHIIPKQTAFFEHQFRLMQDAYSMPSAHSALMVKGCLYAVAERFFKEISFAPPARLDIFEQARQYLKQHFRGPVSIQALADSLGVSRSHLYKQFKDTVGQSPQEYLMRLRLRLAATQLLQGNQSMDQIAANCGLRDKGYLSRVFKRYYQMPPGAYRSMHMQAAGSGFALLPDVPRQHGMKLTIENFGRLHTFNSPPKRVVCLDYSTAEMCLALGARDALVGVADADKMVSDCHPDYQKDIENIPFLFARSGACNVPSLADVLACRPDLVIGTSYSFEAVSGVAEAVAFERRGIHIYAMTATCKLGSTLEDTYLDIWNLAQIFGAEERGKTLIRQMRRHAASLQNHLAETSRPVRVFSYTGAFEGKPLSPGQSLESHLIELAGGKNIFSHHRQQYSAVDWKTVVQENPEVILVHRYSDKTDEQHLALIQDVPQLRHTDAVKNGRIHTIGLKKVFPGIDNAQTAWLLASFFYPDIVKHKNTTSVQHLCI
ncbi:MAG: ABC transporter substrate-binding protein [Christensenellales bacterium]|jgi:iron complex transport system substrate-binding protein